MKLANIGKSLTRSALTYSSGAFFGKNSKFDCDSCAKKL